MTLPGDVHDPVEGFKWLTLAVEQNDRDAEINVQRLWATLTPEQIQEAKKRAAEFKRTRFLSLDQATTILQTPH